MPWNARQPALIPHSTTHVVHRIQAAPPGKRRLDGPSRRLLQEPPVDIAELKSKNVGELHDLAEELHISDFTGMPRQDLIFRIEQNLLESEVVLRAEGVLEILP